MKMQLGIENLFRKKCHNIFDDYGVIILLILGVILLCGDDLLEHLFCDDMGLIWIILIVLLLMNFDDGCGCC